MKIFRAVPAWVKLAFCVGALAVLAQAAHSETMRVEAMLVWGTDDPQSPNPKHHPVDDNLARRLRKAPYRWKNYFLVSSKTVDIADGENKSKIEISKRCVVDIKNEGANRVEVRLHGDGKPVSIHRETLPLHQLLILSGDAGNENGWLVILRRVELGNSPPPVPLVKNTN